ncbi:uncharacterized protein LOC121698564 isoform X2 [Alosa sapidissima]|uniref:uncharacterized protein LOC121698564 isoform X2 n=1 Tax=Alosa sapidissima TaxID=34773 RepID=UPI001C07FD6A|nr:uncharacterized protein LOC121698564 isoform X2 [Alosa sapidissima]
MNIMGWSYSHCASVPKRDHTTVTLALVGSSTQNQTCSAVVQVDNILQVLTWTMPWDVPPARLSTTVMTVPMRMTAMVQRVITIESASIVVSTMTTADPREDAAAIVMTIITASAGAVVTMTFTRSVEAVVNGTNITTVSAGAVAAATMAVGTVVTVTTTTMGASTALATGVTTVAAAAEVGVTAKVVTTAAGRNTTAGAGATAMRVTMGTAVVTNTARVGTKIYLRHAEVRAEIVVIR